MKFELKTIVDITETNARRGTGDNFAFKQQSNFQTVLQTLTLRANITYEISPRLEEVSVGKLGLCDKYKGKQMLWTFDFEVEQENALTTDMLYTDFDLIPIITGLTETAKIDKALFRTSQQERNIIFNVFD